MAKTKAASRLTVVRLSERVKLQDARITDMERELGYLQRAVSTLERIKRAYHEQAVPEELGYEVSDILEMAEVVEV